MTGPQEPRGGPTVDPEAPPDLVPSSPDSRDHAPDERTTREGGADASSAAHPAAAAVDPATPETSREEPTRATSHEEVVTAPRPAPVGSGVPARPQPLPPPRGTGPRPGAPTQALPRPGAATSTVVPGRGTGRPAPPRPPLATGRPLKGRKARLALRRLDPWSVFVMSLLLSLFLAVITIVAAFVLYGILSAIGVPHSINKGVTEVKGGSAVLTEGRFVGVAALIAAINVVLLTALATLGSLLYNVCASFTGGLEVTLAERD
jgi:hypothetical protein